MQIQKLKIIGLTEGEIRVYQSLLEIGECTKTKLSKKSEVSPSKIYDVTNRLMRKGIITAVKKQGVLHFKSANPQRLNDFLEQKEQELQKEKDLVHNILPTLMAKYHENEEDIDINVFYGWDGLKTAFLT